MSKDKPALKHGAYSYLATRIYQCGATCPAWEVCSQAKEGDNCPVLAGQFVTRVKGMERALSKNGKYKFLNLDIEKTKLKQLIDILLSESRSKLPRKDRTSLLFGGEKPIVEEIREFQEEIRLVIEDLKGSYKPGHWILSAQTHDLLKMGTQGMGLVVVPNMKEKAINLDLIEVAPRHYKNIVCHSLINFLDQKRGIDKIQSCPECSMWFVSVKGKKYCNTKCQNKASTRLFRERDPEGYRKYQREKMRELRGKDPVKYIK